MKILVVIPSRYASSRFPGKPMADICGKSMVQRVYGQAAAARVDKVVVATDDARIAGHVKQFGGQVLMTGTHHANGTSRCREAVEILENRNLFFDVVINVQGDEPMIRPEHLNQVANQFRNGQTDIATLVHPISSRSELFDPNVVKVVTDNKKQALYFSRHPIPFLRNEPQEKWPEKATYYKHIGIYGYRTGVLKQIVSLPGGKLESAEKLEQLRWLENGYRITTEITDYEGIGVDTPEDLQKLINKICNNRTT